MYTFLLEKQDKANKRKIAAALVRRLAKQKRNARLATFKRRSRFILTPEKVDSFYWKYVYGDIVISKFINFLVKSGYKNRAIRLFFVALLNMKSKFGINPILLIKYIVIKRNTLHKVTTKKGKKKDLFYLRIMDFDKQISNTVRKIMALILFIKEKKQLKLWQSILIILLNFCMKKKKKKKQIRLKYNKFAFARKIKKALKMFSRVRRFTSVSSTYLSCKNDLKKNIFLMSRHFQFFFYLKKYIRLNLKDIQVSELGILYLFCLFYKAIVYYVAIHRIRLFIMKRSKLGASRMAKYKVKCLRFISSFMKLRNKRLLKKIRKYRIKNKKRKILLKEKWMYRNKDKHSMITKAYFKELKEFKKAAKFKNAFLNFRLFHKKRRELATGIRLHLKYDVRLRHRKIFFRVSKYGQIKK